MDTQKTTTRHTIIRRHSDNVTVERETELGSDNCECSYCHRKRLVGGIGQQLFVYFTVTDRTMFQQHTGSFCSDVCHDLFHNGEPAYVGDRGKTPEMAALGLPRTVSGRLGRKIEELEATIAHLTWAIDRCHGRGEPATGYTNRKISKIEQLALLRELLDPPENAAKAA